MITIKKAKSNFLNLLLNPTHGIPFAVRGANTVTGDYKQFSENETAWVRESIG